MLGDTLNQARTILSAAAERGIELRLAGSVAIVVRCPSRYEERRRLEWTPGDIDFACLQKDARLLGDIFRDLGYQNVQRLMVATEGRRWTLLANDLSHSVDVFFDRMEFCHTLDLEDRISIDPETLTVADLLLSKLQYVSPRQEDLADIISLIESYPLGSRDGDLLNIDRIGAVLANSWGFFHTANLNIERIRTQQVGVEHSSISLAETLEERLKYLCDFVKAYPKGTLWKLRGLIGTKMKWFNDVEAAEAF